MHQYTLSVVPVAHCVYAYCMSHDLTIIIGSIDIHEIWRIKIDTIPRMKFILGIQNKLSDPLLQ